MKKIISLFMRNYDTDRLVRDEIVPGAEWVVEGRGVPTVKYDGTCCMVRDGQLFKRYDRKLNKKAHRRRKQGHKGPWAVEDFKPAPPDWIEAQSWDSVTAHWPGWRPVGDGPEDQWHREAFEQEALEDGTYELVGPKVQGNPHDLVSHVLWLHGVNDCDCPRTFEELKTWFADCVIEGIVWWEEPGNPDSRMVKIKRRDFGYPWPPPKGGE